jgi:hypothetical protein
MTEKEKAMWNEVIQGMGKFCIRVLNKESNVSGEETEILPQIIELLARAIVDQFPEKQEGITIEGKPL